MKEAVVVGDGTNHNYGLVFVGLGVFLSGSFGHNSQDGHWGTVDAGHEQATENDLVEVGVCAACFVIAVSCAFCYLGLWRPSWCGI